MKDRQPGGDRQTCGHTLWSIKATSQKKGRCVMKAAVANDVNLCQEGCLKPESGSLQTCEEDERRIHQRGNCGWKQNLKKCEETDYHYHDGASASLKGTNKMKSSRHEKGSLNVHRSICLCKPHKTSPCREKRRAIDLFGVFMYTA